MKAMTCDEHGSADVRIEKGEETQCKRQPNPGRRFRKEKQ